MMPAVAAAMVMKLLSTYLLRRFGYRQVLTVNTVLIACTISAYALVGPGTPLIIIVLIGLSMGPVSYTHLDVYKRQGSGDH